MLFFFHCCFLADLILQTRNKYLFVGAHILIVSHRFFRFVIISLAFVSFNFHLFYFFWFGRLIMRFTLSSSFSLTFLLTLFSRYFFDILYAKSSVDCSVYIFIINWFLAFVNWIWIVCKIGWKTLFCLCYYRLKRWNLFGDPQKRWQQLTKSCLQFN